MTNLRRYLEFWEWLKTESQTEVNALYDQIVKDIDTRVKCANAKKVEDEPQTCNNCDLERCETCITEIGKTEPQTERSE